MVVRTSDSTKKWPDLWVDRSADPPVITVTREWAAQTPAERRKRLVHELLHLVGMEHNEQIGYSTHPERDTFSMTVYHAITGKRRMNNPILESIATGGGLAIGLGVASKVMKRIGLQ